MLRVQAGARRALVGEWLESESRSEGAEKLKTCNVEPCFWWSERSLMGVGAFARHMKFMCTVTIMADTIRQ